MVEFLIDLFSTEGFPARWTCGNGWERWPSVGWLIILADLAIFLAYIAIPFVLAYFIVRRKDVPFPRIGWLFCAFIFACGTTHLVEALLFWTPVYRVSGLIKLATALVSWATVLAMIPIIPIALMLTSPAQLRKEILQRNQELRDSEARLRAIVETAGDCILTLDDEMTILTANPAAERLFGLPPESLIGMYFSELMADADQSWGSKVGTGEGKIFGMSGGVTGQRADGTTFPASLSMSKVNLEQGRVYTAIIHDLSQFKKTEEALRHSETRLRLMLAQVPAILCTTDRKLRVTLFTSSAATGLSGTGQFSSSRRFLGESLDDPNSTLSFLPAEAFQRALEGEAVSAEVQWQERVFQFHIQALRDSRNQTQGTIGVGLDVTQRQRTEAALQFYAEELQHRNEDLLRSNQELDEFAYIASHDLKEPLRGIHNYASFLIEDYNDRLDQDGKDKLQRLQYLSSHMAKLIDSLLEFSRVGRVEMGVQPTDLNEAVVEVLNSLRISLQAARVKVRLPRPLPTIRCDRVRIAEVFVNLITNAMKYNDKEKKWIEIGATDKDHVPESVRHELGGAGKPSRIFYVRDNGIGIAEKHWGAIFRIFKRLHGRDKFGGGTGAGLTIVKKIIERHGGQIMLDSTPGEGTTFFFTIPEIEPPISTHDRI